MIGVNLPQSHELGTEFSGPVQVVTNVGLLSVRGTRRIEEPERRRLGAMSRHERSLWRTGARLVAGVDEVGAGCLAGPVMAAAVLIAPGWSVCGVDDSKALTPERREALVPVIQATSVAWAIGSADVREIDRLNILVARLLAMRRAVEALAVSPAHVLVDGNREIPGLTLPQTTIADGDALCISIAAASVVAKVARDELMTRLDRRHPGYAFAVHKGYPTPAHRAALRRLGPCSIHRMTFTPVADAARRWRRRVSA